MAFSVDGALDSRPLNTVVMRLAAPMQSWGTSSRFSERHTDLYPSKSGVVGLMAAACGYRRGDRRIGTLAESRFGVRIDSPGTVGHDFGTAEVRQHGRAGTILPLSNTYHLMDATFVAAAQFEDPETAQMVAAALNEPRFTIYLGRKTFLPAGPVGLGLATSVDDALNMPWTAPRPMMAANRSRLVKLTAHVEDPRGRLVQDQPLIDRFEHSYRRSLRTKVSVLNPQFNGQTLTGIVQAIQASTL